MKKRLDQAGKILLHTAIFFMVAIVVIQGAVTLQPLNLFAGWSEKLPTAWNPSAVVVNVPLTEEPIMSEAVQPQQVSLTLGLQDITALPHCRVLVNGKETACFDEKNIQLTLAAGDLLEVDATYYNFPIAFEITAASENLAHPKLNQQYQVQQGIIWLGEIQTNH